MAIEYTMEIEGNPPNWEIITSILNECDAVNLEFTSDRLKCGDFGNSGIFFYIFDKGKLEEVSAENFPKDQFLCRYSIVFRFRTDQLSESMQEVKYFCLRFSELTTYKFVLSYQFELVCGFRLDQLIWQWD